MINVQQDIFIVMDARSSNEKKLYALAYKLLKYEN